MKRRALLAALAAAAPVHARQRLLQERLPMAGRDGARTVRILLPPSYFTAPQRRYPVLYLHDGQNLFDDHATTAVTWGVDTTLARLAQHTGFEAIAVGIDHGGERRVNEMTLWPHPRFGAAEGQAYLDFIVGVVKPLIDAHFQARTDAASTLVGGSSMGGLISHLAIHRHPEVFGRALVFSPAYWIAPEVGGWLRERPLPRGARIAFYAGGREGESMLPDMERVLAIMQSQRIASMTRQIAPFARHDEAAWRAAFEPALRGLFELG